MVEFKFAMMGAGNISNKFCDAVKRLDNVTVAAVASKSLEKAEDFAKRNGVPEAYGDYREMLEEVKPDCVYIGVVPSAHYELSMLCLDYNIPVLCEKAMFMNSKEAEEVFRRSREQKVFVMEALWSRFLPATCQARKWIREGKIGEIIYCDTTIGFLAPAGEENRYRNEKLGGGAAHDILVYAYELTTYMLEEEILEVSVSAVWGKTGVDLTDHVILRTAHGIASLTTSFAGALEERMVIYGDKGKIVIPNPHFSSEAYLYDQEKNLVSHFQDEITENGFTYEIEETIKCIREGLVESSVVPHRSTIDCARVFDRIAMTK